MIQILAVDCGATQTRAGLYNSAGNLVAEGYGGPANPVSGNFDAAAAEVARTARPLIESAADAVVTVAVAMAGLRDRLAQREMCELLSLHFPGSRMVVTDDQTSVLLANARGQSGIVITAGTGSCVLACDASGNVRRVGGRGPLLGDEGSGYAIAAWALLHAARSIDGIDKPTALVEALPHAAGLAEFEALIGWSRTATKTEIAGLAKTVCEAAASGDGMSRTCLNENAARLAAGAAAARTLLGLDNAVPVFLNGGLFEHAPNYSEAVIEALRRQQFASKPILAPLRGHAAVREMMTQKHPLPGVMEYEAEPTNSNTPLPATERMAPGPWLDALDARGIVDRMTATNREVDSALAQAAVPLAQAMQRAAESLASGGRIVYIGAGTSGRLGVLDASECRPTFGIEPGRVLALMAGGEPALTVSVEEAEDRREDAIRDVDGITPPLGDSDFLVGISASGTTPYAIAAIEHARSRGAATAMLTCNAASPESGDIMIHMPTGPEVLPGSTRLKAGTATKLALNIISTGAFALAGYVFEGRMVGVRPVNDKLRRRAARILAEVAASESIQHLQATGLNDSEASELLRMAGDRIPVAVLMHVLGATREAAEARLAQNRGNLRAALE